MDCDCEEDEGWGDEEEQSGIDSDHNGDSDNLNLNSEPDLDDQPRLKRQRLNISILTARRKACEDKHEILKGALKDIEKLIRSRKITFVGGSRGLQSYRTQAIESYLRLVVCKIGRAHV